jgi:hypothetical protein
MNRPRDPDDVNAPAAGGSAEPGRPSEPGAPTEPAEGAGAPVRRRRVPVVLAVAAAVLVVAGGVALAVALAGDDDGGGSADDVVTAPGAGSEATLAVDLERIEGMFVEGFDVTLRVYDAGGEMVAEREWSDDVEASGDTAIEAYYAHVLRQVVPAGPVRLVSFVRLSPGGPIPPPEGPGCETQLDVAPDDTARVTLLLQTVPADGPDAACAAVTAATADADALLDVPHGWPAPGLVGRTEDEATAAADDQGWSVRVVARDGAAQVRTEDLREDRVNLVVEDGVVTAAARS